jgi:hypothetical protein
MHRLTLLPYSGVCVNAPRGDNQCMTILLLFLALAFLVQPRPCKPQFAPLETGASSAASDLDHWRAEDAGSWNGKDWVGWTYESTRLVPAELIVRPLADPDDIYEEDRVTVEWRPGKLTFAVRCMPAVRAGRMESALVVNHELQFDGPLEIALGKRRYIVRLERLNQNLADARVVLSDGTVRQVLYSTDGFVDDPHFYVEWAGDLDRDGRLDLVVNLSRKYSMHPHRLLLSTTAKESELVGEAAVFVTGD